MASIATYQYVEPNVQTQIYFNDFEVATAWLINPATPSLTSEVVKTINLINYQGNVDDLILYINTVIINALTNAGINPVDVSNICVRIYTCEHTVVDNKKILSGCDILNDDIVATNVYANAIEYVSADLASAINTYGFMSARILFASNTEYTVEDALLLTTTVSSEPAVYALNINAFVDNAFICNSKTITGIYGMADGSVGISSTGQFLLNPIINPLNVLQNTVVNGFATTNNLIQDTSNQTDSLIASVGETQQLIFKKLYRLAYWIFSANNRIEYSVSWGTIRTLNYLDTIARYFRINVPILTPPPPTPIVTPDGYDPAQFALDPPGNTIVQNMIGDYDDNI